MRIVSGSSIFLTTLAAMSSIAAPARMSHHPRSDYPGIPPVATARQLFDVYSKNDLASVTDMRGPRSYEDPSMQQTEKDAVSMIDLDSLHRLGHPLVANLLTSAPVAAPELAEDRSLPTTVTAYPGIDFDPFHQFADPLIENLPGPVRDITEKKNLLANSESSFIQVPTLNPAIDKNLPLGGYTPLHLDPLHLDPFTHLPMPYPDSLPATAPTSSTLPVPVSDSKDIPALSLLVYKLPVNHTVVTDHSPSTSIKKREWVKYLEMRRPVDMTEPDSEVQPEAPIPLPVDNKSPIDGVLAPINSVNDPSDLTKVPKKVENPNDTFNRDAPVQHETQTGDPQTEAPDGEENYENEEPYPPSESDEPYSFSQKGPPDDFDNEGYWYNAKYFQWGVGN